jgi:hypothetical protein
VHRLPRSVEHGRDDPLHVTVARRGEIDRHARHGDLEPALTLGVPRGQLPDRLDHRVHRLPGLDHRDDELQR